MAVKFNSYTTISARGEILPNSLVYLNQVDSELDSCYTMNMFGEIYNEGVPMKGAIASNGVTYHRLLSNKVGGPSSKRVGKVYRNVDLFVKVKDLLIEEAVKSGTTGSPAFDRVIFGM